MNDPTDLPIGGGGKGYDLAMLDSLDPNADPNGMHAMADPKKKARGPPARFANKVKTGDSAAAEEDTDALAQEV